MRQKNFLQFALPAILVLAVLVTSGCVQQPGDDLMEGTGDGVQSASGDDVQDAADDGGTSPQNVTIPVTAGGEEDCTDYHFTHYLVDPGLVRAVTPIGTVGGGNTEVVGRSYITVKESVTEHVPVYAPRDMVLTMGSHYRMTAFEEGKLYDYGLTFDAGCGHYLDLSHLKIVIPEIEERLPTLSTYSGRMRVEPLTLAAGDLIGYFVPNAGVAAFDFIVDDQSVTNTFPNQERYEAGYGSNLLHSTCPYDYYRGEMKDAYYAFLGSISAGPDGSDCGSVSVDTPGTIAGQWFLNPDPESGIGENAKDGDYGNPLPIVMQKDRITIGHTGPANYVWIYTKNPTHKDPATVTGEHCYQAYPQNPSTADGYVYFKVIDDMTIKVFYSGTGTCPSSFPKEGFRTYYR